MRVALVHSPYTHKKFMENIKIVSNNFGDLPPLGLMYVSSILKNEGHEVTIIDSHVEKLSKKQTFERMKKFNPDIIGFMLTDSIARQTLDWAKYLKEKLKVPVMVGNYCMIHYPKAVMSNEFVDYGIIGSGRKSLPKLLKILENGHDEKELEKIEGLTFRRKNGEIVINYPRSISEDLNKLPFPDRDSIPNEKYFSMASKENPFTIMATSYGCVYKCTFCDMGRFGYSQRKPNHVVDEIEESVNKYGIKEIDFFDRDFLIDKKRVSKICKEIQNRGINVKWSCRARVDEVDDELLSEMKKAGCRLILYGIESEDQKILNTINKNITIKQIKDGLKKTKEHGIETLGFFIIGNPGETKKTINKTIKFAKKLPLDYAQFFKMTGKPRTELYEKVVESLGYDYFERYIKGEIEEKDLPRPWTNFSNEELEKEVFRAYKEFYLRPTYILNKILKIRSLREFNRYIRVGLKMLSS